jgi:hypothetical protein
LIGPQVIAVAHVEVPMHGGTDLALDEARRVIYVAVPMQRRIAVVSLDSLREIQSIPIPGEIRYILLSEDGQRLYGGLYDQGRIIVLDLHTRTLVANVDVSMALGRLDVAGMVEISPFELLAGALSVFAEPSRVVHVRLNEPSSASSIGCEADYGGTALWTSPDRRYLYIATNSLRCPLLEKREFRQPDFPVVRSAHPGARANLGTRAMSADGNWLHGAEGQLLSTQTLWSTGYSLAGLPVGSRRADRYYSIGGGMLRTHRIHDYRVLTVAPLGCVSLAPPFGEAVRAVTTNDERSLIVLGHNQPLIETLCVVDLPPPSVASLDTQG